MQTAPCLRALALIGWLIVTVATPVLAQVPGLPAAADPEAEAPQPEEEPAATAPGSPLASVQAFLAATDAGRWNEATRYLALSDAQQSRAVELTQRLKGVIDSLRLIDVESISGETDGQQDDGLPDGREQVATVPVNGILEPMRLERTSDADGDYWAFSPATVANIDEWYATLPDRWLRDLIADNNLTFLLSEGPFEVLWWQWAALPIVLLLSWAAGRLLRTVVRPAIRRITSRTVNTWDDQIVDAIGPPLTLTFATLVFAAGASFLQLTRSAFQLTGGLFRAILAFALFWALWRSAGVVVAWMGGRTWALNNPSVRNLLAIGSNVARGVIFGVGILAMFAAFGYPVGTILAGLGIGGLALAFGAQKTVENLFGSISLAIDQPFRIGDFVKVEDFVGTVEDVGLRSTRFRTLDRTVVSIPNGKLADQRLESFQVRDRMRLHTTLGVTYSTTREQMKDILAGLEVALRAHPDIWSEAMVVRFMQFGPSSLDIEIMAWFDVPTFADFQRCRQEVLLEFMRVVEDAGAGFAFPTRTVHLVKDPDAAASDTAP